MVSPAATAGDYYLAFYAGSYDETGGGELGASMEIKTFRLLPENCTVPCDRSNRSNLAPPNCSAVVCAYPFNDTNGDPTDGCEDGPSPIPSPSPSPSSSNALSREASEGQQVAVEGSCWVPLVLWILAFFWDDVCIGDRVSATQGGS